MIFFRIFLKLFLVSFHGFAQDPWFAPDKFHCILAHPNHPFIAYPVCRRFSIASCLSSLAAAAALRPKFESWRRLITCLFLWQRNPFPQYCIQSAVIYRACNFHLFCRLVRRMLSLIRFATSLPALHGASYIQQSIAKPSPKLVRSKFIVVPATGKT